MSKRRSEASIVTGNRPQTKVDKMNVTCRFRNIMLSHFVQTGSKQPEQALKWKLMHRIFSLTYTEKIRCVNCHLQWSIVESRQNEGLVPISQYRQISP
jgi:hypothetical protein